MEIPLRRITIISAFISFILLQATYQRMWTGHWGPAFILKTLTPEVPLGLLFIAAALPDLFAMSFVVLGIRYEHLELANHLPGTYTGDLPFSHSLLGNLILAVIMGFGYYAYNKSRVGAVSLFLATLSHFPLEIPEHRKDMRILPGDKPTIGFGLFDSYLITFLLEGVVIGFAYYYYVSKTTPVTTYKQQGEAVTKYLGILLAVEHILFTIFLVPTENVRFVHAPMFLSQIVGTSALAQYVDSLRTDHFGFWKKADQYQSQIKSARYTKSG